MVAGRDRVWTLREIAKPSGLVVRCVAPGPGGMFVVGAFTPDDPMVVPPYALFFVKGGFAHRIAELPFPVALVADDGGGAVCGTHGGLWTCTRQAVARIDPRIVSALVHAGGHAYWATDGALLRASLADGTVDILGRWGARITGLAHDRGTLYWLGVEEALAPPHVLPGGFAILPADDAPRTLYARDTAGGAVRQLALGGYPIVAIAVTTSGVFATTRGGVSEQFAGQILHLPHGGVDWQVLATARKLPSHLIAYEGGVAWSHERELGYVVEGYLDGRLVTIAERTHARLVALAPDAGELVLAENRVKPLRFGGTFVTSEYTLLAAR